VVINSGAAVCWQGQAGEYAIIYLPPGDTAQPLVEVVVLGAAPQPQPNPNPDPQPDPPPPPGKTWGIILRESDNQKPPLALLLQQLREAIPGSQLRIADPDNLPDQWSSYAQAARESKLPLPVLVVVSEAGSVVKVAALPTTVAAVKKELGL
jgi:hypothetical protein